MEHGQCGLVHVANLKRWFHCVCVLGGWGGWREYGGRMLICGVCLCIPRLL
jgi:hypothetical protein